MAEALVEGHVSGVEAAAPLEVAMTDTIDAPMAKLVDVEKPPTNLSPGFEVAILVGAMVARPVGSLMGLGGGVLIIPMLTAMRLTSATPSPPASTGEQRATRRQAAAIFSPPPSRRTSAP